jgi:hypothetical protein
VTYPPDLPEALLLEPSPKVIHRTFIAARIAGWARPKVRVADDRLGSQPTASRQWASTASAGLGRLGE